MEVKHRSDKLSVSGQILPDDIAALAERGFRSIICNRPDGEESDQPNIDEIRLAGEAVGIEVRYQPVVLGEVSADDVAQFVNAMRELPKPMLAYCRTGTRAATLWSLSQTATLSIAEILSTTKAAGYEMSGVVPRTANGGKTLTD